MQKPHPGRAAGVMLRLRQQFLTPHCRLLPSLGRAGLGAACRPAGHAQHPGWAETVCSGCWGARISPKPCWCPGESHRFSCSCLRLQPERQGSGDLEVPVQHKYFYKCLRWGMPTTSIKSHGGRAAGDPWEMAGVDGHLSISSWP